MIETGSVQKALLELANRVYESDATGATRLRLLGEAVIGGANVDSEAWAATDIYKFIDADSIVEQTESHYSRQKYINYLELARNTLVLGPIIVTWFGISQAVPAYNALLNYLMKHNSPLISQPFLYWWEQSFKTNGFYSGFPFVLTLGSIALIDAAILLFIFILTFVTYSLTQANLSRRQKETEKLRAEIIHALAGASLCLQSSQQLHPLTAGNNLESVARQIDSMARQTTTQFQKMAEQVLNQFTAMSRETSTRFEEMANLAYTHLNGVTTQLKTQLQESEKYLMKLNNFAGGLDQLSMTMQETARKLVASNGELSASMNDLVEPARELTVHQRILAEAVNETVVLQQKATTTLVDLGRRQDSWGSDLSDTLEMLNEAVEKAVQLASNIGGLTTQQASFLQWLEKERDAQRELATLMADATVSVRESLDDMDAGGRALRSMAHDMKDLLDLQYSSDTASIIQNFVRAAQAIGNSADSLDSSARMIYTAGQKLTNVLDELEDRITPIK